MTTLTSGLSATSWPTGGQKIRKIAFHTLLRKCGQRRGIEPYVARAKRPRERNQNNMLVTKYRHPETVAQEQQQQNILQEATDHAAQLAASYDIDGFKVNAITGQIHWLTSARRIPAKRGGGLATVYSSDTAIMANAVVVA